MSRVLLDTQLVLWALAGNRRLPRAARRIIEDSDVVVSAASIWEIAIKAALGKLDADPTAVREALAPSGFDELPVTGAHAARVASLPFHHRDPFDRLLVAQSELEPLTLVTTDAQLRPYGGLVRVLDR
jgi:PIN domain nuclease of toxin-antitoxin system